MSTVKVAIVGAGHLGTYHLQKMLADPKAQVVGVVEPNLEKRDRASHTYNVPTYANIREIADTVDAAVIAAPTPLHYSLTKEALQRGWHVLVEKPLTTHAKDAEELVSLARQKKRILQVGHVERYNPAIAAALNVVDEPLYIISERLGPFSGRSGDVDVVLDLMIHDLDIVATLIPSELSEVRAIGVPVLTNAIDMAAVRLQFKNGAVAQLSAGRASLEPSRKIRLFTRQRYVSIDCAKGEVHSVRRLAPEPGQSWPQLAGEPIEVEQADALARQDSDFLNVIRTGATPRVDGVAGWRAVQLAEEIKKVLQTPF